MQKDKEKLIDICDTMIKECIYGDCGDCSAKNIAHPRCKSVHFADVLIKNNVGFLKIKGKEGDRR